MLHLDQHHDVIHITCDCGRLSITAEVRGRIPDRLVRCNGCGDSAKTATLLADKAEPTPVPQPTPANSLEPGVIARLARFALPWARRRAA